MIAERIEAPHPRTQCDGWRYDADGNSLGLRCHEHGRGRPRNEDAIAIRGLLVERAGKPDPFTVESVFRWTRFAGHRSIGGIVAQLAADGVIVRTGSTLAERPARHAAAVATWVGARWLERRPGLDG